MVSKKNLITLLGSMALSIAGGYFIALRLGTSTTARSTSGSSDMHAALRTAWTQQIFLTRNYMLAEINETGDSPIALEELLAHQETFGTLFAERYSPDIGQQMTTLLKEHILIAVDLLAAAKAKSISRLRQLDKQWRSNAQELATLLHTLNPQWQEAELKDLLKTHLTLTAEQVIARLGSKWKADLKKFEALCAHALEMADFLASGLLLKS